MDRLREERLWQRTKDDRGQIQRLKRVETAQTQRGQTKDLQQFHVTLFPKERSCGKPTFLFVVKELQFSLREENNTPFRDCDVVLSPFFSLVVVARRFPEHPALVFMPILKTSCGFGQVS